MSPMSYYYNSRAFPPTLVRMAVPEPDYVQQAAAPISVGPSKRSRNSVSQPEQQAVEIPAEAMMRLRRSEAAAVGPAPEEEEKEIGVYRRSIDKLKTLQNIDSDLIHMARPR